MLNKEFTYKGIVITRGDYESMPCPMYAHEFNDEKMEELVKYISDTLRVCYGYDEMFIANINSNETTLDEVYKFEEKFSEVMETCAIDMNMRYYEDMSDDEYNELVSK